MARKPIRVSQLNSYLAKLIAADGVLSDISVIGEVSNFKVHGSGHVYFSLIDDASRIDCFLGSGIYRGLEFELRDGTELVAEGYVNVYEKGGRYSLNIRRLSEEGQGGISQDFERLKKKLGEKGYFDEKNKKAIPDFPLRVAIVTSETGAAVNDIIKIITSRNSVVSILVYPTLVQGEGAADMIAARIRQVNEDLPAADVMIVGRGGGSSEDLAAFNEEKVADAIYDSKVPVISAVGHETDFTISDFVADKRAETPTAAAVLACPDTGELSEDVEALYSSIRTGLARLVSNREMRIRANNMEALIGGLKSGVSERGVYLSSVLLRIQGSVRSRAEKSGFRAQGQIERLEALSPLKVLSRGYAIVEDTEGHAVTRAGALAAGDETFMRFSDGSVSAIVKKVVLGGSGDDRNK